MAWSIRKWRAENDPQTLAIALIEIAAPLDEKIRGVAAERICERHVIRGGQRFLELIMVEDLADDHRQLAPFSFEI